MNKIHRRKFLKRGLVGGALGLFVNSSQARSPTPTDGKGPYYPVIAKKDKDSDLTRIEGMPGVAKGKVIHIQGKVMNTDGESIEGVTVDLWQANAAGRYRHPHDSNNAPLDDNFQGWAIIHSGTDGAFRIKTIFPGAYPASSDWIRPPHIHFKVNKTGYFELVTQMYFPDHELNKHDYLLNRKSDGEQKLMIANRISDEPPEYEYNIVLEKV